MKTLVIIAFIYFAFKFLAKTFGPMLVKRAINKMQQKAEQQFRGNTKQQDPIVKEGETVIDKKVNNTSRTNDNVGDYVEFEEID